jgi:trehalose 6-phosphate phosphatase
LGECALFLDLDGTLVEFAPHPNAVSGDPELIELLWMLTRRTGGAVAMISGRSIDSLDAVLHPLKLPASGLHGFERRNSLGVQLQRVPPPPEALAQARRLLAQVVARDTRLRFEDKGCALALHYRQAPHLEAEVLRAAQAIASLVSDGLVLQLGPKVAELVPYGVSKATAVDEFMREPPFAGRRPLFVGDDLADEPVFEWMNAAGGLSVAVNARRPTAAQTRLRSVGEVRAWLHGLMRDPK